MRLSQWILASTTSLSVLLVVAACGDGGPAATVVGAEDLGPDAIPSGPTTPVVVDKISIAPPNAPPDGRSEGGYPVSANGQGQGGSNAQGGSGGSSGKGNSGSGGSNAEGGSSGSGGSNAEGGSSGSGGSNAEGGSSGSGGSNPQGGSSGSGGSSSGGGDICGKCDAIGACPSLGLPASTCAGVCNQVPAACASCVNGASDCDGFQNCLAACN